MSEASSRDKLEYWASFLSSPTLSVLPHDYIRPALNKSVESTLQYDLPGDYHAWCDKIVGEARFSGMENINPFTIYLSCLAVLIFRLTGDEDILIATNDKDNTGKQFVVRLSLSGTTSFGHVLTLVDEQFSSNTDKALPLHEILNYIKDKNGLAETPVIFRVTFQHDNHPDSGEEASSGSHLQSAYTGSVRDLSIFMNENTKKLKIYYNSLLFKKDRISIFADQLSRIARVASLDSSIEIGKIHLVTQSQSAVLPDPTTNLNWSKYKGSIQDIFQSNAEKFPDRTCVTETASFLDPNSKDRVFTYQQINESSNVVAHYLISNGIKLGDVVMIYAYRGVDLVVAVMGVLKAGATFSVIDPAYPPARQNIYLSVARPRALVVIKKAGIIAPLVEEFIDKELELLARVNSLELHDDGTITGGEAGSNSEDVFEPFYKLKAQPTGVLVGPDSNPTLSFTSGSEGIPKGVKGRHFSLTYYFPWMSEKFNLSSNDRFTMLSGIAHDPIQRDIFTPLFLGAQLLVPTADDIGTPGRLAEWMDEYKATVTHLTPAMGQLLSAQATHEIKHLHHAFFVGDILTKRDCVRLQTLAENCAIVNMYGTTETQRSVSFFQVPPRAVDPSFLDSQKDVMPAGRGMIDVQLIIVNRYDRSQSCAVGEVGEIYVRAGGLAEGYLKLPELTATKFVRNWYVDESEWLEIDKELDQGEPWRAYWFGPRDRLYRTGDLGRYLPDGNTECCGRADDQVKIRGFRIELGEIDTHLSQHPLVRENVTLVRRDKDEEPVLISYIVPKGTQELDDYMSATESLDEADGPTDSVVQGLVKYRRLIQSIRDFLKTRLSSYAIPTVIVPLSKMPLNPNGKVDKPALPFPDTAQLATVAKLSGKNEPQASFSTMEAKIRDLWLSILPTRPATVTPEDSFFDMGGHSILATRMIFELRNKMAIDIPLGTIFKFPTISAFAAEVERVANRDQNLLTDSSQLNAAPEATATVTVDYAQDAEDLISSRLESSYPSKDLHSFDADTPLTFFLTGATGFLGSFILRDLLTRKNGKNYKIITHVRAKDAAAGFERIRNSSIGYGCWDESFAPNIIPFVGNLEEKKFGLSDKEFEDLANEVDIIIHNGALVHWIYPYSKLRGPNVIGTVNLIDLCSIGKPKFYSFVSTTSTVDSEKFIEYSDLLVSQGKQGIPETDDLERSKYGLPTGYGQSKWAAEHILREAGNRGLRGAIVRPGYVTGDSVNGYSNTDDYIVRMIKGCVQLGQVPDIYNTTNMVPVDHVARLVTAAALHPPVPDALAVVHVTSHPRRRFNQFFGCLEKYGYDVKITDYVPWRINLEKYVMVESKDNALYPLLHFVLDNLPQNTKSPELDDSHAVISLKADASWTGVDLSGGRGVDEKIMGVYLSYLIAIEFLEPPKHPGELELPTVHVSEESKRVLAYGIGGRGGGNKQN